MGNRVEIRDTKMADDAQQKLKLGWLDHEFTVYGTAYYTGDEMKFRVSNVSDKIYSFMDEAPVQDIYPSNLIRYTERCPLPAGMKEEKNLELKKDLARIMKKAYPKELFQILQSSAEVLRDNQAVSTLEKEREELEGCFDGVRLSCFQEVVRYSYQTLKLSRYDYNLFMKWIEREYKNLEDDFIPKQISEGNLFGMMYLENGKEHYVEDALREYIFERKFQLEQKGILTTPLYKQTFWYDYQSSFREARLRHTEKLNHIIREYYLVPIQQIRVEKRNAARREVDFADMLQNVTQTMGEQAAATLKRYLYRWDVAL